MEGRMLIMVPVCEEMSMVAGETTRLLSLSKTTARVETRAVSGLESWGGVLVGVG